MLLIPRLNNFLQYLLTNRIHSNRLNQYDVTRTDITEDQVDILRIIRNGYEKTSYCCHVNFGSNWTIITTSLAQAATIGLVGEPKKAAAATIAISGDNIYIAWWTNKTGNDEVMFRASDDGWASISKMKLCASFESNYLYDYLLSNRIYIRFILAP
jgi:hypothetical protein